MKAEVESGADALNPNLRALGPNRITESARKSGSFPTQPTS